MPVVSVNVAVTSYTPFSVYILVGVYVTFTPSGNVPLIINECSLPSYLTLESSNVIQKY